MKVYRVGLVLKYRNGTSIPMPLEHFHSKTEAVDYVEKTAEGLRALLAEFVGDERGKHAITVQDVLGELGIVALAHELVDIEPADGSAIVTA